MFELNRIAFVIKPTELMYEWIQTLPQDNSEITLEDIREDGTVLLLPDYEYDEVWDYFESMAITIFENELASWTPNEDLWPSDRSLEMFREWFELEQHSLVIDLAK
ncbi:MAG: hypothetical protein KIT27_00115 [Legionellales bacterium]|nr:hypothetical protein [Legionellales bacterium]